MGGTESVHVRCYGRKRRGFIRIENWHHPAVLKGKERRYEAAMKHAVAASTAAASERLPCWSQVFHFDGVGWKFKPVPVGFDRFFRAPIYSFSVLSEYFGATTRRGLVRVF